MIDPSEIHDYVYDGESDEWIDPAQLMLDIKLDTVQDLDVPEPFRLTAKVTLSDDSVALVAVEAASKDHALGALLSVGNEEYLAVLAASLEGTE